MTASADQIWSVVGDFFGRWHPAISTMTVEHDKAGRLIRVFTVKDDNAIYRERLTWFSNSERSLAYTHVEGIEGAQSYNASLKVTETGASHCTVSMAAQLTAEEPRASQIATGTQAIFDDAISTLKTLAPSLASEDLPTPPSHEALNSSTAPHHTRILNGAPNLALSYRGTSATNDTLCLFLHGIGGNRKNWENQLTAVSVHCTSAALDLRGYGDSALGDKQSTVDDYCKDIIRVTEVFGAKQLILCGLSYGAWIATSFAIRHPERLSGLVLSGGCTGMSEAGSDERDAFRRSRELPLSEGKTPADFAPDVVALLAGPDISASVRDQLLESMRSISSQTYADALRCFTNPAEIFDFASITMPVLLMTGDADKLAPADEIKKVAERIHRASPVPDVRFECLERAGHLCNLETPEAFNAALLSLVQRVVK
jgi:pimeloyl-ACP methyl ester carboxylesterase